MTNVDIGVILLSLLIFKPLTWLILCYPKSLFMLYRETDLFCLMGENFLGKLDRRFGSRWVPPIALTAISFLLQPFIQWESLDPSGLLRLFILCIAAVIAWEAGTNDIDLATGKTLYRERGLLVVTWIALYFYPGFLILFLFIAIHHLRSWHNHQLMQLEMLFVFLGFLAAIALLKITEMVIVPYPVSVVGLEAPLFLLLSVAGSMYVRSGISKIRKGKRWYTWAAHNHLSHLVMSAYMWGWLRTWSKEKRISFSRWIKWIENPLQFWILLYECAWIFAGFDKSLTEGLCLCNILFHLMVLATSGLCFWQPMLSSLFLLILIAHLPGAVSEALFNPLSGFLYAALQLFDNFVRRLWEQLAIAWWDTPFIEKLHWEVKGISGKRYGLYNDFMRPHELFFGRQFTKVLCPCKLMTRQLGEVNSQELRDAIVASEGKPDSIAKVQEQYGQTFKDKVHEKIHDQYLRDFFLNFNRGRPKRVCPVWLRAPGNQLYWGLLPAFEGQEKVSHVSLVYREEFFNGKDIVLVREELLKVLTIPS